MRVREGEQRELLRSLIIGEYPFQLLEACCHAEEQNDQQDHGEVNGFGLRFLWKPGSTATNLQFSAPSRAL